MKHVQSLADYTKKEKKIAVVGLGYVGLPLAVALGQVFRVIGLDNNDRKIAQLERGNDVTGEVDRAEIDAADISFTTDPNDLNQAATIIVTVPTPIAEDKTPDLSLIKAASVTIAMHLQRGSTVVFESTVYPGTTEDICIPILTSNGLKHGKDFSVGYSPERLSPGDKGRSLKDVLKVVSGDRPETCRFLAELYGTVIKAGVYEAASIKVAEAAKVLENTQRDLNVALMNELSIILNKMNINTLDVIETAATKWNFMKMYPGLVGGHCIGVDPYYLTYKAESLGYHPQVILAGRRINDNMGKYVAEQTVKQMIQVNDFVQGATVLILGITFKENVADIRNSKVVDIVDELKQYNVKTKVTDPYADSADSDAEYGIALDDYDSVNNVNAIILAVAHDHFEALNFDALRQKYAKSLRKNILIDIKGKFRKKDVPADFQYWCL